MTAISWERVQLTVRVRLGRDDTSGIPLTLPAPDPGVESLPGAGDVPEPGGLPGADATASTVALAASIDAHIDDDPAAATPLAATPTFTGFVIRDGSRTYPVDWTSVSDDEYDIRINITQFGGRRQIPDGTWRVIATFEGDASIIAAGDLTNLAMLDDQSRVFLYSGNKTAMTISFGLSEDEARPELLMRTYQLFRTGKRGKKKRKRPVKRMKSRLLGAGQRAKMVKRIYRWSRRYGHTHPNRILFVSDQRASLQGNLLRVRDRLVERGLDSALDLRYSFRVPGTGSKWQTLKTIYLIATSRIVLLDDYFTLLTNLTVDKQTRVVQLWHAGSGFKAVGFSRFGKPGSPRLQNPHRQYTYAIAGSTHLQEVYAEVFGIEPESVIPTGLPRIDTFLEEETSGQGARRVLGVYPQFTDKRVVLFAPTFRGRGIRDAHYDYAWIDFDALADACGPDTIVLFRMHHFVRSRIPIPEQYRDRFFDVSDYPDGTALLHITDVLITDYSSIIYEYSLRDKPMLFYAPDKVGYSATRGFHRDFDLMAPGRVCETFAELTRALREEDYQSYKIAAFRADNFDYVDTHAADRVIDWLIVGDPAQRFDTEPPAPTAGAHLEEKP